MPIVPNIALNRSAESFIVPTLCVGTHTATLRRSETRRWSVKGDIPTPERGNDSRSITYA